MSQSLTAEQILEEIEFELLQGAITSDELGKGIQDVRKHHAQLRSSLFESEKSDADSQELIRRQFQINDMLLTILNEVSLKLRANQLDLYRMGRWQMQNSGSATVENGSTATVKNDDIAAVGNRGSAAKTDASTEQKSQDTDQPTAHDASPEGEIQRSEIQRPAFLSNASLNPLGAASNISEIEAAMDSDALEVQMMVRSTPIPVVGWLLQRLRGALHSLTLFYVQQLARRQQTVNHTYGDALIDVVSSTHQLEEQIHQIQSELEALRAQANQQVK